jgi:uncharacterized membrane protein YeaQ/YmgE (transglycosylase-associated protein family)
LTLTLGAALVAVWLDDRFPSLRPKTAAQGFIHAAIGTFAMLGAAGLLQLAYGIPDGAFMALVLGVFGPALVYALLAGLWMLRALANLTVARR